MDREEVGGSDLGHVVTDEGLPGLGRRARPMHHVLGDRGLADVVADLALDCSSIASKAAIRLGATG